jgi:hypothetical protein
MTPVLPLPAMIGWDLTNELIAYGAKHLKRIIELREQVCKHRKFRESTRLIVLSP